MSRESPHPNQRCDDWRACYAMLRRAFLEAGIRVGSERKGLHLLRHSAASRMLSKGVPVTTISHELLQQHGPKTLDRVFPPAPCARTLCRARRGRVFGFLKLKNGWRLTSPHLGRQGRSPDRSEGGRSIAQDSCSSRRSQKALALEVRDTHNEALVCWGGNCAAGARYNQLPGWRDSEREGLTGFCPIQSVSPPCREMEISDPMIIRDPTVLQWAEGRQGWPENGSQTVRSSVRQQSKPPL